MIALTVRLGWIHQEKKVRCVRGDTSPGELRSVIEAVGLFQSFEDFGAEFHNIDFLAVGP